MTALNKQALRSKARSASAGEWIKESGDGWEAISSSDDQANGNFIIAHFEGPDAKVNREFVQVANPATVLALLDELEAEQRICSTWRKTAEANSEKLEAAEKRIAEQQSAIIAPGIMRCAGCGFVLTKNSVNLAAGTITAGDSKTEPCPNGCGPLWPVTWKEHALQMRDDSEKWFEELQEASRRIAELEARELAVKQFDGFQIVHYGATEDYAKGYIDCQNNYNKALAAAGIGVKGE